MRLAQTLFISALALLWAGTASAAPEAVTFTLVSSVASGGAFPSTSTYTPALPLEGSGTIDEAAGTWLIAGFDELAAAVPGCIPLDRGPDAAPLGQVLPEARDRGLPFSGVVWRAAAPTENADADHVAARLEAEIGHLLSAVHAVQGGSGSAPVTLPDGLWIVTERGVACESGEDGSLERGS